MTQRELLRLIRSMGERRRSREDIDTLREVGTEALPMLMALLSPDGELERGHEDDWIFDLPYSRRLAAQGLGVIKDPSSVDALMSALDDKDPQLRAKIFEALGEVGDQRAIPVILPFLGDLRIDSRVSVSQWTRIPLRKLGCGDIVDAFLEAMKGDPAPLCALKSPHEGEIAAALIRVLETAGDTRAARAARALGELGAVEALPALRSRTGLLRGRFLRRECREAIAKLESLGQLPRPAEAEIDRAALPRAASTPDLQQHALPREMSHAETKQANRA